MTSAPASSVSASNATFAFLGSQYGDASRASLGSDPDTEPQSDRHEADKQNPAAPITPPVMTSPPGAAAVEQRSQGSRPGAALVASVDGLGVGFEGPQRTATLRNPSDNSLAVGNDHVFQIVNTRMAIFTKKGKRFKATGKVLYGPVPTNTIFKGFGGACEPTNNGDASFAMTNSPIAGWS